MILIGTSGMLFGVATGCDPNVRTTVLGGFQSLATSVVQAFFLNIESQGDTTTPATTGGTA